MSEKNLWREIKSLVLGKDKFHMQDGVGLIDHMITVNGSYPGGHAPGYLALGDDSFYVDIIIATNLDSKNRVLKLTLRPYFSSEETVGIINNKIKNLKIFAQLPRAGIVGVDSFSPFEKIDNQYSASVHLTE